VRVDGAAEIVVGNPGDGVVEHESEVGDAYVNAVEALRRYGLVSERPVQPTRPDGLGGGGKPFVEADKRKSRGGYIQNSWTSTTRIGCGTCRWISAGV
jgi:hypothetical protein